MYTIWLGCVGYVVGAGYIDKVLECNWLEKKFFCLDKFSSETSFDAMIGSLKWGRHQGDYIWRLWIRQS